MELFQRSPCSKPNQDIELHKSHLAFFSPIPCATDPFDQCLVSCPEPPSLPRSPSGAPQCGTAAAVGAGKTQLKQLQRAPPLGSAKTTTSAPDAQVPAHFGLIFVPLSGHSFPTRRSRPLTSSPLTCTSFAEIVTNLPLSASKCLGLAPGNTRSHAPPPFDPFRVSLAESMLSLTVGPNPPKCAQNQQTIDREYDRLTSLLKPRPSVGSITGPATVPANSRFRPSVGKPELKSVVSPSW